MSAGGEQFIFHCCSISNLQSQSPFHPLLLIKEHGGREWTKKGTVFATDPTPSPEPMTMSQTGEQLTPWYQDGADAEQQAVMNSIRDEIDRLMKQNMTRLRSLTINSQDRGRGTHSK